MACHRLGFRELARGARGRTEFPGSNSRCFLSRNTDADGPEAAGGCSPSHLDKRLDKTFDKSFDKTFDKTSDKSRFQRQDTEEKGLATQ